MHARLLTRSKCRLGLLLLLLASPAAAGALPVAAQEAGRTLPIETRRQSGLEEYERVTREMTLTDEKLARLAADIATVKKDSGTLTGARIQSAQTEKKRADDITENEQRRGRLVPRRRPCSKFGRLVGHPDWMGSGCRERGDRLVRGLNRQVTGP